MEILEIRCLIKTIDSLIELHYIGHIVSIISEAKLQLLRQAIFMDFISGGEILTFYDCSYFFA